jgi:hypothetical protein
MTWAIVAWAVIWAGAGLAVAAGILVWAVGSREPPSRTDLEDEKSGDASRSRLRDVSGLLEDATASGALPVAAGWSFKDSWAADLTALLAAGAAIVAAFGEPLESVVPKIVVAQLAVVAAFGTAVTALGPILYSTLQEWKLGDDGLPAASGTTRGLLAAAAATLIGLFASLGALAWVAAGRDWSVGGAVFVVALLFVSALVAAYAARTLNVLLSWATIPDSKNRDASRSKVLVGILTQGCCGDQETSLVLNLL